MKQKVLTCDSLVNQNILNHTISWNTSKAIWTEKRKNYKIMVTDNNQQSIITVLSPSHTSSLTNAHTDSQRSLTSIRAFRVHSCMCPLACLSLSLSNSAPPPPPHTSPPLSLTLQVSCLLYPLSLLLLRHWTTEVVRLFNTRNNKQACATNIYRTNKYLPGTGKIQKYKKHKQPKNKCTFFLFLLNIWIKRPPFLACWLLLLHKPQKNLNMIHTIFLTYLWPLSATYLLSAYQDFSKYWLIFTPTTGVAAAHMSAETEEAAHTSHGEEAVYPRIEAAIQRPVHAPEKRQPPIPKPRRLYLLKPASRLYPPKRRKKLLLNY